MQLCQGDAVCFYVKAKAFIWPFERHLGIIKITCNRTATHFMDDSFVNLGEEVILTLLRQYGASEYLLLTVQLQSFAHCVCVCARV